MVNCYGDGSFSSSDLTFVIEDKCSIYSLLSQEENGEHIEKIL